MSRMAYFQLGPANGVEALGPANIGVDRQPIFRERVRLGQTPQIMGELLSLPGHARPLVQIGKGPAPAITAVPRLLPNNAIEPSLKPACQIEISAINRQDTVVQNSPIKPLRKGDRHT